MCVAVSTKEDKLIETWSIYSTVKNFTQLLRRRWTDRLNTICPLILIRTQNQPLRARMDVGIKLGIIKHRELIY